MRMRRHKLWSLIRRPCDGSMSAGVATEWQFTHGGVRTLTGERHVSRGERALRTDSNQNSNPNARFTWVFFATPVDWYVVR
jgi:hypothetical protein